MLKPYTARLRIDQIEWLKRMAEKNKSNNQAHELRSALDEVINKNSNDMKEEIDNILEGFHKGEYDLITVKSKLLILFGAMR